MTRKSTQSALPLLTMALALSAVLASYPTAPPSAGPRPNRNRGPSKDFVVKDESESIYVYSESGQKYSIKIPIAKELIPIPASGHLEADKTYQLYREMVTFKVSETVPRDEFYLMEVTGIGKLSITVLDEAQKELAKHYVALGELKVPTIIVFDSGRYLGLKGHSLRMQNVADQKDLEFWTCQIRQTTSVDLEFNSSARIVSIFAKTIKIKSRVTEKAGISGSDTRYQFTVDSSLESQKLVGDERISMHINGRARRFPTTIDFEQKAAANYGTGLVKTISKSNPSHCGAVGCVYYITVTASDVDFFYFYPAAMLTTNMYRFGTYMELLEELEGPESLFYELVPPKNVKSLLVSYAPIERESDCLLNIGWPPSSDEDFLHRFPSDRNTEFHLTEAEFKAATGLTNNRIYMKCTGKDEKRSSTFHIKATSVEPSQVASLRPSQVTFGSTFDRELINYFIDFKSQTTEIVNLGLALEVNGGSGLIIAKECTVADPHCRVDQNDLKMIQHNPASLTQTKSILRFTTTEFQQGATKVNNLNLNFHCDPRNADHEGEEEYYLESATCKFAIGLWFSQDANAQDLRYRLETSAANNHKSLVDQKSKTVKASPAQTLYYKLALNPNVKGETRVNIKVFVLTGRATLYIANNIPYPFENNFQKRIQIQHEAGSHLETKTYNLTVTLKPEELKNDNNLYLTLTAERYTILDILPSVVVGDAPVEKPVTEVIQPEVNYARSIQAEDHFVNGRNQTVYFRNFVFKFPKGYKLEAPLDNLELNLNTNVFGLKLCVYRNPKADVSKVPCDYETNIEHLILTKIDIQLSLDTQLLISVQKVITDRSVVRLPIEFGLFTSVNDQESIYELHMPGSTLRSFIEKGRNIKIRFDLTTMTKSGSLFFTSEDSQLRIDIFKEGPLTTDSFLLTTLKDQQFGLLIRDSAAFKSAYCNPDCVFYAFAYTLSPKSTQFSFTYTIDDKPIVLKDGLTLRVPSQVPLYFLYETKSDSNVNFNAYSPRVKSVGFSRLVAKDLLSTDLKYPDEINEIKFDLKSDIDNSVQLVYSKAELKQKAAELILFLVEPKFGVSLPQNKLPYLMLTDTDVTKVYVQTEITKLEGFTIMTDTLGVGEIKYYAVQFKEAIDFSLTTLNVEGAVTMYVAKGENEYPTNERYWLMSANAKGDIIVIRSKDYVQEDQALPAPGSNKALAIASKAGDASSFTFIIGVYGVEASSFSLLFLPKFKNLIKVDFQRIVDLKLDPGSYYYLDFSATESKFESMIYADDNDVEAAMLTYSEDRHQDLVTMIGEESNFADKRTLHHGDVPIFGLNKVDWAPKSHLVLRLLTMGKAARVNFLLFDPNQPILAPAEKRFHFVQTKKTQSIFKVKLNAKYKKVDVDVKLAFGQISVSVSDKPTDFSTFTNMSGADQKTLPFELSDSENDIIIFKEVYIKVISAKGSKFALFVKPKDRFKHVLPGEPEMVRCDPNTDIYLYFALSAEMMPTVKSLELELHSVFANAQRAELLFANPSVKTPDSNAPLQPMAVLDFEERTLDEMRQAVYQLQVIEGYYVVKIPRNPNPYPVKLNFILNKMKSLQPNGLFHGLLPTIDKPDKYSLYVSEPGEYRLVWESCLPINVHNILFKGDQATTQTQIEGNLLQTFPVIVLDETLDKTKRELQKISYPIIRGTADGTGLLTFQIAPAGEAADANLRLARKTYALMSEFKPKNKELILKDYVEIFKDDTSFNNFSVAHEFLRAESKLRLSIRHPTFKMQLLDDYPGLQKVQLKFKIYLFAEPNFVQQIRICGLSAIEAYEVATQVVTIDLSRDDLKNLTADKHIEVVFERADLERFRANEYLNVVCYLSARFLESEEEQWQVTMDLKYTNVPYFLLTIRNGYLSAQTMKAVMVVLLLFIASLAGCFCAFCNSHRKRQNIENILKEVKGDDIQDIEADPEEEGAEPVTSMMSENEKFDTSAN
jgi:hypothetical protein